MNSVSAVVDLRERDDWTIQKLLNSQQRFEWPTQLETVRIDEICAVVGVDGPGTPGQDVVTPSWVDPRSHAIQRFQELHVGPVFRVHAAGEGLGIDDLLVPRSSKSPVIRITHAHFGLAFSSEYLAIRPLDRSLELWAVLNSTSGQRARMSIETWGASYGRNGLSWTEFLALEVPDPSKVARGFAKKLWSFSNNLTVEFPQAKAESWWRVTQLSEDGDWRLEIATNDPELLLRGVPLESLCVSIKIGRLGKSDSLPFDRPGWLPVVDLFALRNSKTRFWSSPTEPTGVLAPGDICLSILNGRVYSSVLDRPSILGSHAYGLRLVDSSKAQHVSDFLVSSDARQVIDLLWSGSGVTRLSQKDLGRIPIPQEMLDAPGKENATKPVAELLEAMLWS